MKTEVKVLLGLAGGVLLVRALSGSGSVIDRAVAFISKWESFSPTPYWDYKQWSIGYGTAAGYDRANKPAITVTREQALQMLRDRVVSDSNYILSKLSKAIPGGLMVALLSFAYNLGRGNADKIIALINRGIDLISIGSEMLQYVYAGGERLQGLVERRGQEIALFLS